MSRRQLAMLLLCTFVPFTAGNSMFTLMPIYATRLGGDAVSAGYNLSISYVAISFGLFTGGWLADRFQYRKMLVLACGVVNVPAIWLIGHAADIWQLTALTATVMFFYGIALASLNMLTGIFSEEHERGRVFGIIGAAPSLGSLVGGIVSGPIVDRWGFAAYFTVVALWSILQPLFASFLEDKDVSPDSSVKVESVEDGLHYMLAFPYLLLILATIFAGIAPAVTYVGIPILMDQRSFDVTAVSSTTAVAGLMTLPLPPLVGWLSDRIGRKPLIIACFLICAVGMMILSAAVYLWHFWLASVLLSFLRGSTIVGSASVTDTIPPKSLGVGLSVYGAMPWVANIIGTACAGNIIQQLGAPTTFTISALLPLIGIVLIVVIRQSKPPMEDLGPV